MVPPGSGVELAVLTAKIPRADQGARTSLLEEVGPGHRIGVLSPRVRRKQDARVPSEALLPIVSMGFLLRSAPDCRQ